jgi:twitching motility protein PilT
MAVNIEYLLNTARDLDASDLHLNIANKPAVRIDGNLKVMSDQPVLKNEDLIEVFNTVTNETQRNKFLVDLELDFSYEKSGLGRFRVNALMQKGAISLAFRLLAVVLSPLKALGLKPIYGELALKPRGLILVTGPTGSGKSTSLAAMVNYVNEHVSQHIITIEDPIEYIYESKKSIILQRGLGDDTRSFSTALIHALRHDPDIIVVGEMRDLTTIATAISAAETGHLVMATLHTLDATETVNRVVEVFPVGQQEQIKLQLSQVLLAVLSQALVPRIGGGRVPACEIMINNTAIKHLIREGKVHQIFSTIQMSGGEGMQTLIQSLADLVNGGVVSKAEALLKCGTPDKLEEMISGK